jgi:hypothetical protein
MVAGNVLEPTTAETVCGVVDEPPRDVGRKYEPGACLGAGVDRPPEMISWKRRVSVAPTLPGWE